MSLEVQKHEGMLKWCRIVWFGFG